MGTTKTPKADPLAAHLLGSRIRHRKEIEHQSKVGNGRQDGGRGMNGRAPANLRAAYKTKSGVARLWRVVRYYVEKAHAAQDWSEVARAFSAASPIRRNASIRLAGPANWIDSVMFESAPGSLLIKFKDHLAGIVSGILNFGDLDLRPQRGDRFQDFFCFRLCGFHTAPCRGPIRAVRGGAGGEGNSLAGRRNAR